MVASVRYSSAHASSIVSQITVPMKCKLVAWLQGLTEINSDTLPGTHTEWYKVLVKLHTVLLSLDPSLRLVSEGIRKDSWILMDDHVDTAEDRTCGNGPSFVVYGFVGPARHLADDATGVTETFHDACVLQ